MAIVSTAARRPARDIMEAVVANMPRNLERLEYSTLAQSRYTVYLLPEAPMIVPVMDYVDLRFEEQMHLRPAHKQAVSCASLSCGRPP